MGVLRVLADNDVMLNPLDDRLYSSWQGGVGSLAGVAVTPETALTVSAVWRAVDLLASTIAKMPLIVYHMTEDGGKERAGNHPLYGLLHTRPNSLQTSFEWREMMMGHALLRGHGYSEIIPGPRGPVDELRPLHPDRVTEDPITVNGQPVMRYKYRQKDGTTRIILDEDMFHLRGPFGGVSIIQAARESLGMGIALSKFGSATFGNGVRPSGAVTSKKVIGDTGRKALRREIEQLHRGPESTGRLMILDDDMDYKQMGLSLVDAEYVKTMQWTVEDWARWFGIPPHKLMHLERSTNNNIEHQGIEFVVDAVLPWSVRWEQTISRDLIVASDYYFAEFLLSGLMRGDTLSRYQAYAIGRQWGWLSANDIRRLENMNPIPGGNSYLVPLNMVPADSAARPDRSTNAPDQSAMQFGLLENGKLIGAGSQPDRRLQQFATDAASRVVRKETAAMRKLAGQTGASGGLWEAGVREFYDDHGAFVARTLRIADSDARQYARDQRDELLAEGSAVLDRWESERVVDLTSLVLYQELAA